MNAADEKVERGAHKLEQLVAAGSRAGGVKAKVAKLFADDPEFLRQLKPSLIAARAKGEAPTDQEPTEVTPPPAAKPKSKPKGKKGGGPGLFVVLGAAFAVGIALAHGLDWAGHRHPRD
jgi:hypothetical protein